MFSTDETEIINVTNLLQSIKSSGIDEITTDIMKRTIQFIAEPLSKICNVSFEISEMPDLLKIAKVCPIYKGGQKNEFANYRPISILPSFSKIVGKLVYNRLYAYVTKNNILSPNQFGFRSEHSTSMALVDFYDKVSQAVDNKEFSIGIFINLQKAFDTVNHQILLDKLSFMESAV